MGMYYTPKIDVWAAGLIMAELYNFVPLISGKSAEDQLYRILAIFGAPTEESWPEGLEKLKEMGFKYDSDFLNSHLKDMVNKAPANA